MAGSRIPLVMRAWRPKKGNSPGLIRPAYRPHIELKRPRCPPWGVADARLQVPAGRKRSRTNASQRCLSISLGKRWFDVRRLTEQELRGFVDQLMRRELELFRAGRDAPH